MIYTRDNLPDGDWGEYRKLRPTRMIRMDRPFKCETVDGNVALCSDGWLAIDSAGHPYPIDVVEQAATYEPV